MEKAKNNNGIFYIVISLIAVLAIAGSVAAYTVTQNQTVNIAGDYNNYEATDNVENEETTFGASPGGDFYNPSIFHDSLIGNGSFNIPLNWQQATTTGDPTTIVLGKLRYTGPDTVVCSGSGNDAFIYVDGLVPYTATYRMGTTTPVNNDYLTSTTTSGIITGTEIATSTSLSAAYGNVLNADDEEGSYTRETFILKTNEIVVISLDFTTSPTATSSMPTLPSQGLTASGFGKISCKKAK